MPDFSLSNIRKNLEFTERTKGELRQLFHPYYIINLILAFSFLFVKLTKPFCELLFAPGPVCIWSPTLCSLLEASNCRKYAS